MECVVEKVVEVGAVTHASPASTRGKAHPHTRARLTLHRAAPARRAAPAHPPPHRYDAFKWCMLSRVNRSS